VFESGSTKYEVLSRQLLDARSVMCLCGLPHPSRISDWPLG